MDEYSRIIADNLILLRKKYGMTQQEFAKVLNYSDKTISKWELGYASPSVETLKQIADYYNLSVDYFLKEHTEIRDTKLYSISKNTRRILTTILVNLFFLSIAATVYAAIVTVIGNNYWIVFIWAIVACCFFNGIVSNKWWKSTILPYVFVSLTIWSTLIGLYISLLITNTNYNFWYLFFVGLPIQFAAIIIITLTNSSTRE